MKKLTTLLIAVALLGACRSDSNVKSKSIQNSFLAGSIRIVEIDSCEYIITKEGYSGGVCHKGNCKNPIHWKVITR